MGLVGGHSAAGQALGYVYQVQWALVELVRRSAVSSTTQLRIETLDDIESTDASGSVELTQVKHQITPASDLTENSVDLWRSLNVWMDVLSEQLISGHPVLKLVTTATIPEDSLLNFLRRDTRTRDVEQALDGLETAASEGKNKTTQIWRNKFVKMSRLDRQALIDAITIEDASPSAGDLNIALHEALRFAWPRGREDAFLTYLLGWWSGICVRLLDRSLPAITADDLETHITDLRDRFLPDNLPVAPDILVAFSQDDATQYSSHQFVQQLLWISIDEPRLWLAVRDYHRAWAQRSEWLRLNLTSETELDHFAFKLHDEWEHIFYERLAKMKREANPDAEIVGQEVLERLCADSKARVRDRLDEPWLTRGTLHALADGWSGHTIGWHPEFQTKLEQLLSGVAK